MITLEKKLTDEQILMACKYINRNDRNSDIMALYCEYIEELTSYDVISECLKMILGEWEEDIRANGITKQERHLLSLLSL